MRSRRVVFLTVFCLVARSLASGEEHSACGWEICAEKRQFGGAEALETDDPSAGNGRKYARHREIDIKHLELDLTPDFRKRSLRGVSRMSFVPIATPLRQLSLDAVDLDIESIEASSPVEDWDVGNERILITFAEPIEPGKDSWVRVRYSAEPKEGWYFRTREMGYPEGDDHFWTQGQPEKHRHWFPGYDYPNERFTTEVICRVDPGMTVLSNGRLLKKEDRDGKTVFHWLQDKEHVNYLISVVGGFFQQHEDKHGDLPIAFFTPPSEFPVAKNSFRDTARILAFLEAEIGVGFPWDKYYNVCVADFVAGGMENTSVTTLTTRTLFHESSETIRTSHQLDAHEAAHQWFGNLLTCKDWSHVWLNEGFATYYTHLYEEHREGRDSMRYGLYQDAERILKTSDRKPIVWREYKDPWEQFDYRAYPKGSWVLHMLRSQVGADLFRKCVRTYVERNRNRNVVTEDLNRVFEELTGRSWDEFFDQWVYHAGTPKLKANYAWDQTRGQAKINVAQTQEVSDAVMRFDFPLPVRFVDGKGRTFDFTVRIHQAEEDFFFALPEKPAVVRIDPEYTLLFDLDFKPPHPMLLAQLERGDDMIGRLLAVKALGERKDGKSIEALKKALRTDSFYGVRMEAADSLAAAHTGEAFSALLESREQEDARVRRAVISAIGKFYREEALVALKECATGEKNPEIVAKALEAAGKFPEDSLGDLLAEALHRSSYRNRIAVSAVQAMRTRGDPGQGAPLLQYLEKSEALFDASDFGAALDALAFLSRDLEGADKESRRVFIARYLDHPKEQLRRLAMKALGTLGDARSIPLLEAFAGDGESEDGKAATAAIRVLNEDKKQADEVKDLRKTVLDLEKEMRELKTKVETLDKQAEPEEPTHEQSNQRSDG